jgi:hypothetical protein
MVDYHLPDKLCKSENFMYFFPIRTLFRRLSATDRGLPGERDVSE